MNVREQPPFIWIFMVMVGFVLLVAGGCMVGPNYHPPKPTAVSAEWVGVGKMSAGQPYTATAQPADLTQWWRQFNDPILTELVQEALERNLSVQLAREVLRQARAARGVAIGALFPAITGSASYQRFQAPVTPAGQPDPGKSGTASSSTPSLQTENLFQAGFDAVWELDIFGGLRRNVESANANVQSTIEGIRNAQVTLVGEVALNYIQLRGYQQQIVVAQNNLKAQQHTADITRKLYHAGFDSALDQANADASVATTESQIPVFETEAQQSIYALSVLLGRPPGDLLKQLSPTGNLPAVPAEIHAGLPSDLLRRRPDIRQSEAQLHAATAQIGVATADLFPQFSLTGSGVWSANLLRTWWNAGSRSSSVGPSVTWPIFQGGALLSNVHLQEALRNQAFITYQSTVLAAFQDVENQLIAFAKEQQHRKSLNDAVIFNRKAVDLSLLLYTEGQVNFLNVLIAQESLYAAESALVQSETNIVTDLIALYKALGGGWESY